MDKQTPSAVIRSYNNLHYNKVERGVRRVNINSTLHLVLTSHYLERGNTIHGSLKYYVSRFFQQVGPPPVDFSWNPQYESDFLWYDQSLVDATKKRPRDGETENLVLTFFEVLALCHTVMPSWKTGEC